MNEIFAEPLVFTNMRTFLSRNIAVSTLRLAYAFLASDNNINKGDNYVSIDHPIKYVCILSQINVCSKMHAYDIQSNFLPHAKNDVRKVQSDTTFGLVA